MKKRNSKKSKYRSKFERATAEFLRTQLVAFQYELRKASSLKQREGSLQVTGLRWNRSLRNILN